MNILIGIAAISFLIVTHEFGHLIAGKLVGAKTKAFSLGFGPRLAGVDSVKTETGRIFRLSWIFNGAGFWLLSLRPFSLEYKEWSDNSERMTAEEFKEIVPSFGTDWRICAIPLGGYVEFWSKDQVNFKGALENISFLRRQLINISGPLVNIFTGVALLSLLLYGYSDRIDLNAPCADDPTQTCQVDTSDPVAAVKYSSVRTAAAPMAVISEIPFIWERIQENFRKDIGNEPIGIAGAATGMGEAAQADMVNFLLIMWSFALLIGYGNLLPFPPLDGSRIWKDLVDLLPQGTLQTSLNNVWIFMAIILLLAELTFFSVTTIHDLWLWMN